MIKSLYNFEVIVNGSSAKEYMHEGRTYIEGKEGSRFSLRMRNMGSSRVLFVPTVDGLSIMNGKEGSFKSRGYIVNGYSSTTIEGWRTSDDKVAEFYFAGSKESYAVKKGKGGNLGVIGCAVFKEKEKGWKDPDIKYVDGQKWKKVKNWHDDGHIEHIGFMQVIEDSYQPFKGGGGGGGSGAFVDNTLHSGLNTANYMNAVNTNSYEASSLKSMQAAASNLGTGFGGDKISPTVTVDFDREDSPEMTFSIYYNTREALKALGIQFKTPAYVEGPSAFPMQDDYCERP